MGVPRGKKRNKKKGGENPAGEVDSEVRLEDLSSSAMVGHMIALVIGVAFISIPLRVDNSVLDTYDLPKQESFHMAAGMAMVLAALSLALRQEGRSTLSRTWWALPLVGGILANLVAIRSSMNVLVACFEVTRAILGVGIVMATVEAAATLRAARVMMVCAALGGLITSWIGLSQWYGNEFASYPQVAPPAASFGNKNMASEVVVTSFAVLLPFCLMSRAIPVRILSGIGLWIMSCYLFAGHTRAAWLAALVCTFLGFMLAFWPRRDSTLLKLDPEDEDVDDRPSEDPSLEKPLLVNSPGIRLRWNSTAVLLVGFVVVVSAGLLVVGSGRFRESQAYYTLVRTFQPKADDSVLWRFAAFSNTLGMIRDFPLGVGPANWQYHYPKYHEWFMVDSAFNTKTQATTLHNDVLQAMAEIGLPGVMCLLALIVGAFRFLWITRGMRGRWVIVGQGAALGVVALTVDMQATFPLKLACPSFFFFGLIGLLVRAEYELTGEESLRGINQMLPDWASAPSARLAITTIYFLGALYSVQWVLSDMAGSRHMKNAAQAANGGDWKGSVREYLVAIDLAGYVYNPYILLGRSLFHLQQMELACEANKMALVFHPCHSNIYYNQANALREIAVREPDAEKRKQLLEQSLNNFQNSLALLKENPDALNNMANLLKLMGRPQEAIDAFDKALAMRPGFTEALLNKGAALSEMGKEEEAKELYKSAVEKDPDSIQGYHRLANMYLSRNDVPGAIELYKKALEKNPDFLPALNNLGAAYWQIGDAANAEQVFLRAVKLNQAFAEPYFGLGDIYVKTGQADKARQAYSNFVMLWQYDDERRKIALERLQRLPGSPGTPAPAPSGPIPSGLPIGPPVMPKGP